MKQLTRDRLALIGFVIATAISIVAFSAVLLGGNSDQDLVKLRNSLLYTEVEPGRLKWQPEDRPANFAWEEKQVPPAYTKAIDTAVPGEASTPFDQAISLAQFLVQVRNRSGNAVQRNLADTLIAITRDGEGYCADYTMVFNALALGAEVPVREWGLSFDGFGGDGHAFNEIYDNTLGQWVFLDPFYSLYVVDESERPLSVLELREGLMRGEIRSSQVRRIDPEAFMFRDEQQALDYYRRGVDSFFLIWGNNVVTYDQSVAVTLTSTLSRAVGQATAIILGLQPEIYILTSETNKHALVELSRIRMTILVGVLSVVLALGAFTILLWGLLPWSTTSKLRRQWDKTHA